MLSFSHRPGSVIVEYTVAASGSPITTSELDTTLQSALSSSCHLSNDTTSTQFQSANCVHGELNLIKHSHITKLRVLSCVANFSTVHC